MTTSSNEQPNYRVEIIVVLGYLLLFCLFGIACTAFYYLASPESTPSIPNHFATSLPAATPSPHIPSNYQMGVSNIFKEDFNDNQNSWTGNQGASAYEFKDGKLFFESLYDGDYAIMGCSSKCSLNESYYLQADLSTDKLDDDGIGIVFNMQYGREDFFLFEINPASRKYFLYHHRAENWSRRMSGMTDQIQAHPAVNTLGIYVNKSLVEFYINGEMVDTYQDSGFSFQAGNFGFYIDDAGYQLIVDNLTVDKAGEQ